MLSWHALFVLNKGRKVNEWFHISHSGKCFNHSCLGNGKWNVVFAGTTYTFNSYSEYFLLNGSFFLFPLCLRIYPQKYTHTSSPLPSLSLSLSLPLCRFFILSNSIWWMHDKKKSGISLAFKNFNENFSFYLSVVFFSEQIKR